MKRVHAASVGGTAAVEAAVRAGRAINERLRGQLQPVSSADLVALQMHRQHRHQKRARRFIHPNLRQRRAGNKRLQPLCCLASRSRGTAARLLLMLTPLRGLLCRRGQRAHSSPLRSSKLPSRGTGAVCFRESRFRCDAEAQKRQSRLAQSSRAHSRPVRKLRANRQLRPTTNSRTKR